MSSNDEIGYGKPPKHNQFRKGISGNPKGRPKGSRNLATVLAKALREKVVVNENGRRRTMTKLDAAIAQLVNKSASGDLAALRQLMTVAGSTEDQPTDSNETTHITEVDAKIMESVLKRLEGCSQEGKGEKNQ
jgi:alpha-ketoglutarate-dependent taurine dioxygenase